MTLHYTAEERRLADFTLPRGSNSWFLTAGSLCLPARSRLCYSQETQLLLLLLLPQHLSPSASRRIPGSQLGTALRADWLVSSPLAVSTARHPVSSTRALKASPGKQRWEGSVGPKLHGPSRETVALLDSCSAHPRLRALIRPRAARGSGILNQPFPPSNTLVRWCNSPAT